MILPAARDRVRQMTCDEPVHGEFVNLHKNGEVREVF